MWAGEEVRSLTSKLCASSKRLNEQAKRKNAFDPASLRFRETVPPVSEVTHSTHMIAFSNSICSVSRMLKQRVRGCANTD